MGNFDRTPRTTMFRNTMITMPLIASLAAGLTPQAKNIIRRFAEQGAYTAGQTTAPVPKSRRLAPNDVIDDSFDAWLRERESRRDEIVEEHEARIAALGGTLHSKVMSEINLNDLGTMTNTALKVESPERPTPPSKPSAKDVAASKPKRKRRKRKTKSSAVKAPTGTVDPKWVA